MSTVSLCSRDDCGVGKSPSTAVLLPVLESLTSPGQHYAALLLLE